jgi:hypothetical protein
MTKFISSSSSWFLDLHVAISPEPYAPFCQSVYFSTVFTFTITAAAIFAFSADIAAAHTASDDITA